MTTTTNRSGTAIPVTREPGQNTTIGSAGMAVQAITVKADQFAWTLYRNAKDEWWETCEECAGSICFTCAGSGISRLAGSEPKMVQTIRFRVRERTGRLNAVERAAMRERARAEDWSVARPNLAHALARERVYGTLGANPLGDIALALTRGPLSVKQERYALTLLAARAWEQAHANAGAYVGSVGEPLTVTGSVATVRRLPNDHPVWGEKVLIVLSACGTDEQAMIKISTGSAWAHSVSVGDTLTVSGIVRSHQDRAYGKQTVLAHPVLVD